MCVVVSESEWLHIQSSIVEKSEKIEIRSVVTRRGLVCRHDRTCIRCSDCTLNRPRDCTPRARRASRTSSYSYTDETRQAPRLHRTNDAQEHAMRKYQDTELPTVHLRSCSIETRQCRTDTVLLVHRTRWRTAVARTTRRDLPPLACYRSSDPSRCRVDLPRREACIDHMDASRRAPQL